MKNLIFKNQTGFSILQGLVMASILAGTALVGTRLITDQKLAQKGSETRDQVEELHQLIYSVLQNREHCTNTLLKNFPSTNILSTSGSLNAGIITAANNVVYQINPATSYDATKIYMNGNVIIKGMSYSSSLPASITIDYERLVSDDVNKRTKSGFGAKNIRKVIPLMLQKQGSNFLGCYAYTNNQASAKDFCEGLQPFLNYDPATNTCVFSAQQCPANNSIFLGISSNGTPICSPITSMNLSNIIDSTDPGCSSPTTSQTIRFDTSTGKLRIVCTAGSTTGSSTTGGSTTGGSTTGGSTTGGSTTGGSTTGGSTTGGSTTGGVCPMGSKPDDEFCVSPEECNNCCHPPQRFVGSDGNYDDPDGADCSHGGYCGGNCKPNLH